MLIHSNLHADAGEQEMEVDTGAAISIISDGVQKSLFPDLRLHNSSVVHKTYTGKPMEVVGNLHVDVCYKKQQAKLVLVAVGGNGLAKSPWSKLAEIHPSRLEQNCHC